MKIVSLLRSHGTVAFVFLSPWQARLILRESLQEWDLLSLFATEALVAVLLLLSLFDASFRERIRARLPRRVFWPAVIFFALAALTLISMPWMFLAGAQKIFMLGLAFAAAALLTGHEYPRRLVNAFLASMGIQAIAGIAQAAAGWSPASTALGMAFHSAGEGMASVVEGGGFRLLRAYGTLPHPNVLGGFLAAASLLAFDRYRRTESREARIGWMALLSVFLLALFLSFSRSAWIGAVVGSLPLFLLLVRERARAHLLLPLAVVPTVIAAVLFWPVVVGRTTGEGRLEVRAISERVSSLEDGFSRFRESPFFGQGIGQVWKRSWAGENYGYRVHVTDPAHLAPLEIAAELGAIGLLLFLALWWGILRTARAKPAALSALLLLTVLALFDHYLWTLWAGNLLAAFLVFLILVEPNPEPDKGVSLP